MALFRLLAWFLRDRRGVVAPLFAVTIVPIIGAVGVAVDYSRANAARTAMQAALDATALMLSKEAQSLTETQLQQKATEYFLAQFKHPDAVPASIKVKPSLSSPAPGSFVLDVSATADVNTTFMRLFNDLFGDSDKIKIGSTSEVVWGMKRIELALALDNTGSMMGNKLSELKKAAKKLVETLSAAAKKNDDVKIAIIPFATDVNVKLNADSYKLEWLKWDDWDAANYNEITTGFGYNQKTVRVPKDHKEWNGCVQDRDKDPNLNYDVSDVAPNTAKKQTLFPAHQASNCPVSILPLVDVHANGTQGLVDKIDSMKATGNTNVTIGLVWAWHALTRTSPLMEASDPKNDLDKVIILLTDGENTQNRFSNKTSAIDRRTEAACANVKNAGIKIYTIRVLDGNASLLRNCATRPEMYYDVQNADQLSDVFKDIAQNLANLRLSK